MLLSTIIEKKTIGISVMSGANAMAMPLNLFPLMVSEITIVNKGPGAIPAARPKVIPYNRYSPIFYFLYYI